MDYAIPVPFWNQKEITPPPILSMKFTSNTSLNSGGLRSQLTNALKELGKTDVLHKEAAILSRLLYMMRKIFRQDKGFKCAQMLLKTLRNTLSLNYKIVVTSLRDCCHSGNGPSKQAIEWGLVATLRFGAVFHRIHYLAERAVTIFKERFISGWNWLQATLCFGLISRVWALADFFVVKACTWYSSLSSFLPVTLASDDEWLPKGCSLPSDLGSWLGNPPYLLSPASVDSETSDRKLTTDSKPEDPLKMTSKASTYQLSDILKRSNAMELEEDMGEAVVVDQPPEPCSSKKGLKRKANIKDKLKLKKKRKKV